MLHILAISWLICIQCRVQDLKDDYGLKAKAAILDLLHKAKLAEDAHASVPPVSLCSHRLIQFLIIFRTTIPNSEFWMKKGEMSSRVRSLLSPLRIALSSLVAVGRKDLPRNVQSRNCLLESLLQNGLLC
jgi:hypothetical protein